VDTATLLTSAETEYGQARAYFRYPARPVGKVIDERLTYVHVSFRSLDARLPRAVQFEVNRQSPLAVSLSRNSWSAPLSFTWIARGLSHIDEGLEAS
jgi:hypothetical protein